MDKSPVIFMVGTFAADPTQEAAFNQWYSNTHIPEILAMPGVKSGTRYEILDPEEGYPKYLALYEMDGEEGYRSFEEHRRKQSAGEIPSFTPGPKLKMVWRKAYKRIAP